MEWRIYDQDIQAVEELLLPHGAHFPEDAREVIRCWHSTDVAACPGSGKTTVLLAKLELLADQMPLENGAGICVLSHTNVAVDEIKKRLLGSADKLLGYPNYIGTIQSFIDRFVTVPYLRASTGRSVHTVDDTTYVQHMLHKMKHSEEYGDLDRTTKNSLRNGNQFTNRFDHTKALYIRHDGALCVGRQTRAVARADSDATTQYHKLISNLLKYEGIIRYRDAYSYARDAINDLPKEYTDLFSTRFQYVFIDEYQDCDILQRQAIDAIFDPQKCAVFKIGDSDQAIYNSAEDTTPDWIPQPDFLPIMTSCRFNQEIANVLCKLKKGEKNIVTLAGETGVKPVLLVFSPEKIDRVIGGFISALERHELYDRDGIYKAIGSVKREDLSGLKIGSYWTEFDGSANKESEYSYWVLVDEIVQYLLEGKLYKAEQIVRKLLCRVFHYIPIKNPVSGKDYTIVTMKNALDEKYREQYHQWIYEMPRIQMFDRHSVDHLVRQKINELLRIRNPSLTDIFTVLPAFFLEESTGVNHADIAEKNVLIDPIRGRRIIFDTIHGVKGETHDATLYLETDRQGASDLNRILPYFGVGRYGSSSLYDSSRKLAYVGMSRPKKLLCVAMQAETYEKSKGVFDSDWEVILLNE